MSPVAKIGFGVALLVLVGLSQPVVAQKDWPIFRGNMLQTGVSNATLPEALVKRWTFNAKNPVQGSPVILGQTVFFVTAKGKLHAVDLAQGKPKWDYQATPCIVGPAAHDGAVYLGDSAGFFHCVDTASGKLRWAVETETEIGSAANFAQDKILFGCDDFRLYCVSKTGKILWQYQTKEKVRGTPAVVGDQVVFGSCDRMVHIVDLAKGEKTASLKFGGHIAASVAVHGDHAYVGDMSNEFRAADWKKKVLLEPFEAPRGKPAYFSSPAVNDELVIVGSRDNNVVAWHRKTGKLAWTFATKGRVDGSPVIAGKRVLITSFDGFLYVLDTARGTELTRIDLGGSSVSTPAVADGSVIVATNTGDVICLGEK